MLVGRGKGKHTLWALRTIRLLMVAHLCKRDSSHKGFWLSNRGDRFHLDSIQISVIPLNCGRQFFSVYNQVDFGRLAVQSLTNFLPVLAMINHFLRLLESKKLSPLLLSNDFANGKGLSSHFICNWLQWLRGNLVDNVLDELFPFHAPVAVDVYTVK